MATKRDKAPVPLEASLTRLATSLVEDYHLLRAGKISVREARTRAAVAREAMRAVHLQFEGLRFMSEQAKLVGGAS